MGDEIGMIRRPTAFILGAGTRVPYGFPAGEQFWRETRAFDLENLKNKTLAHAPADAVILPALPFNIY